MIKIGNIDNNRTADGNTPLLVTPEHPINKVEVKKISFELTKTKNEDNIPSIVINFQSLEEGERSHREVLRLLDVRHESFESMYDILVNKLIHLWDECLGEDAKGQKFRPKNGFGGNGKYKDTDKLKEGEDIYEVSKQNLTILYEEFVKDFNTFLNGEPIYIGVKGYLKVTFRQGFLNIPTPRYFEKFKYSDKEQKVLRPTTLMINPKKDNVNNKIVDTASPIAENPFGATDNGGFPTFGG